MVLDYINITFITTIGNVKHIYAPGLESRNKIDNYEEMKEETPHTA